MALSSRLASACASRAVGPHLQDRRAAILQGQLLVLGCRPVEIGEVVAERLQIDHLEAAALAAGFRARCRAVR